MAAHHGGLPTGALLRADTFARILGGDLVVLRVLPALRPRNQLFPYLMNLACAAVDAERFASVARATRTWCDGVVAERLPEGRLLVRDGKFETVVVRVATEIGADLVVLPPIEGKNGETVSAIAAKTGALVLVARQTMSRNAVVAATDLRDSRYLVLTRAAEIAALLGATLVALHNVCRGEIDPTHDGRARDDLRCAPSSVFEQEVKRRRQRLATLTQDLSADVESVVASQASATEAILVAARERDADLVLVGTRAAAGPAAGTAPGTAAAVVESSRRSILVVPLPRADAA